MKKFYGTGRRKSSIARVYIKKSKKPSITINDKDFQKYFTRLSDHTKVQAPLNAVEALGDFEVIAFVKGGGNTGQAGAICLGLARALVEYENHILKIKKEEILASADNLPERPWHKALRKNGHLTRDPRRVLRKLIGLMKSRKAKQFSKR